MIQLTEKDLKYIIKESINRVMLNESMTDIAYHFTNYKGLNGILKTNEFHLSTDNFIISNDKPATKNITDKKRDYYLSVTRQKYGDTGYGNSRHDFFVRITLDGRLLNQKYKTIVFDFFANSREAELRNNNGKLPYKQKYVENEERLLSYNSIIPNASKYILRIDIFAEKEYIVFSRNLFETNGLNEKTYIYANKNDFDLQNRNFKLLDEVSTFEEYINTRLTRGEGIFEEIGDFYEGFAKVKLNNKWNLIDTKGKLPYGNIYDTNTWFDKADNFEKGFAEVWMNSYPYYIDTKGNILYIYNGTMTKKETE